MEKKQEDLILYNFLKLLVEQEDIKTMVVLVQLVIAKLSTPMKLKKLKSISSQTPKQYFGEIRN